MASEKVNFYRVQFQVSTLYRHTSEGLKLISNIMCHWHIIKKTVWVSAIGSVRQSATHPPQRAAQGSLAELTKLTRQS